MGIHISQNFSAISQNHSNLGRFSNSLYSITMKNLLLLFVTMCVIGLLVDACGCGCRGCKCSRSSCSNCSGKDCAPSTQDRLKSCNRYKYYCDNGCAMIKNTVQRLCPVTCGLVEKKEDGGKGEDEKKNEGKKEDEK